MLEPPLGGGAGERCKQGLRPWGGQRPLRAENGQSEGKRLVPLRHVGFQAP